ncbi:MAG: YbaK/EbsC family protein [Deltaproteobacteria bacterium]|nr:YbaK/EbsC family protein [Deltaproteobacteria bacterium]
MIYEQVVAMLDAGGFPYRIHTHQPIRTIEEARSHVPHLTRNLLKTVVFKIKDAQWVLASVEGGARIHYKKLADACRVKRRALRSISPAQVESELGFQVGGVGPFPVNNTIRVVLDQGLLDLERIFCGSGRNTHTIEMKMTDLMTLTGATVYPIVKEDASSPNPV